MKGVAAACLVLRDMDGGKDLKGTDIDVAVNALIGALVRNGYLDSISSAILVSVEELKDLEKTGAPALPMGREEALEAAINASGFNASDVFAEADPDIDDVPPHYDVEIKYNGTEYEYKVEAYTGEILETKEEPDDDYRDYKENGNAHTTEAATDIYSAKEIVLTHAGVKAEDAVFIKEKLDYDDGREEYELEFTVGNTKYEYYVDANTGDITDYSVENKNNETSGTAASGEINAEKAQEIELSHAGVKASDAYKIETELDYDDGTKVYEVEFKSGRIEYEYKIDASTGAILEHEAEQDD